MLSEQQQRIMGYFIEEAKDHLNTIEQGLVNLQSTIADSEMVSEVFRAAHSVKGGAAMLGLNSIQHTAHRLEDYFKVLKECPQVRVDQKLETLFLQVYDTLQDQVDHLQGPFGLTDDKAQEAMAIVEPVFNELNQHLISLVEQAGGIPPEDVEFMSPIAAQPQVSQPQVLQPIVNQPQVPVVVEASALQFIFQNDVPARLREMLQLFKQTESVATRKQLQDLCRVLARLGEQFNLIDWCELLETAQQTIANTDNTYRTLAPIVIKDVKRSQELILSGRLTEICASEELLNLLPFEAATEEETEEELESDLTDLLGAVNWDDRDLALTDSENLTFDSDPSASLFEAEPEAADDWFTEMLTQDDFGVTVIQNGHESELNFDLGFEQISSAANSSDDLDLSFIDRLNDEPLSSEMGERNGPEVGTAELNSLADLFEGELPDLGMTWQEEEVINLPDPNPLESPLESSGDFFDLLDQDDSDELALEESHEDDLSGLLNAAALQANHQTDPATLPAQSIANAAPALKNDLPPGFEPPEPASPDEMAMFFFVDEQPDQTAAVSTTGKSEDGASGFQNLDQLFAGVEVDEFAAGSSELPESSAEDALMPAAAIEPEADAIDRSTPALQDDLADWFESESEQSEASPLANMDAEELASFSNFLLDAPASEISSATPFEVMPALMNDLFAEVSDASEADAAIGAEPEAIENEIFSNPFDRSLEPLEIQEEAKTQEEQGVFPEFWIEEPENEALMEQSDESIAADSQLLEDQLELFSSGNNLGDESIAVDSLSDSLSDDLTDDPNNHLSADLTSELGEAASSEFDSLDILFTGEDLSEVEDTTNIPPLAAIDEPIDQFVATGAGTAEFDPGAEAGEFDLDAFLAGESLETELPETELSPFTFETMLGVEADFEQVAATTESENVEAAVFSFDGSGFDEPDNGLEDSDSIGKSLADESIDWTDLSVNLVEVLQDKSVDWTGLNVDLAEELVNQSVDLTSDLTEATALDQENIELAIDSGIDPGINLETSFDISSKSSLDDTGFDLLSFDENRASTETGITATPVEPELKLDLELVDPELVELEPVESEPIDAASQEDFADLEFILEASSVEEDSQSVAATSSLESDEFADLEVMLGDQVSLPIATQANIDLTEFTETNDFADLEALLGDASPITPPLFPIAPVDITPLAVVPLAIAPLAKTDDEFGDLEALLQDTDQKLGVGSSPVRNAASTNTRRLTRRNVIADQTMRVSVKHLDSLNNLVGEMVVNRNSLEQTQERLRQFLDNLLYQVQQLSDVGQRMRDLYERSLLESSLMASRRSYHLSGNNSSAQTSHATGASFDALEMDKFTGFHTLSQEMIELIVRVRESASDIDFVVEESDQVTRNFRQITTQLQEGLTRSRMVPFAQTADRLPRGVRDNAIKYGKQAELHIEGRDTLIDKMIVEQLYDPMTHLVNNAIAHGVETSQERVAAGKSAIGHIIVRAFHQGNQTVISVSDDGAGINTDAVKAKAVAKRLITAAEAGQMSRLEAYDLLFHHGFSTADTIDDLRGRGVGLDVVRNNLSEIRGSISIDSAIGKGSTFTIRLPLTLSISKALCCISHRARIAFPMDGVEDMLDIPKERVYMDEQGQPCIQWRDALLPFQPLSDLLKYNRVLGRGSVYGGSQDDDMLSIVVLRSAGNYLALQVDQVLGEQEIVIKQLEGPVPKPIGVAGATVLGDGRIMPIADVLELIDLSQGRIRREAGNALWETSGDQLSQEPLPLKTDPTVLIVDDSITVRELLSMTFNKVGYRVEQARDGQEAWEKLRSGLPCDLVFCDIEMPRMDGLELLSRLQKDANLCHIPIAMLTSRGADRHRQMAVQLGAKGYFTKPYLEEMLLDAAQRMLKGEVLVTSTGS